MQEVIKQYKEAYLIAEKNLSKYTVRNYLKSIIDFNNYLARTKVTAPEFVDRPIIRGYLAQLVKTGNEKATVAGKISAIRSFFKYLKQENYIPFDPTKGISPPKLDKRIPNFLTIEEVGKLIKAPDLTKPTGQRDRAMLELLYACGFRVSELVSLNLEWINLQEREIRVIGKGSKERLVLMGRPAETFLTKYLNDGRRILLNGKISEAVFVNRLGNRIAARRVQKILDAYAKSAGFKKRIYPHLLRHTFATHMLDNNADLRVVQELLGHASLSTTQVYTHVSKAQSRKVYLAAHPLAKETL